MLRKKIWNHQPKNTISMFLLLLWLLWRTEFFRAWTSLMKNNILHQAGSNFPEYQLTDQLCKMEPYHGPVFFQFPPSFFLIGLRSGLFAGHVIELICLSWWKANTLCSVPVARRIIILKNDIIITKLLFNWWNEKSVQNVYRPFHTVIPVNCH